MPNLTPTPSLTFAESQKWFIIRYVVHRTHDGIFLPPQTPYIYPTSSRPHIHYIDFSSSFSQFYYNITIYGNVYCSVQEWYANEKEAVARFHTLFTTDILSSSPTIPNYQLRRDVVILSNNRVFNEFPRNVEAVQAEGVEVE